MVLGRVLWQWLHRQRGENQTEVAMVAAPRVVGIEAALALSCSLRFLSDAQLGLSVIGGMVVGNALVRSSTEATLEDMVVVVLGGTVSLVGGVWFVVVCRGGWEGTRFAFALLGGMVLPVGVV